MAVAADHVGGHEIARRFKARPDRPEQTLEVQDVMQGAVGEHAVIRRRWTPFIEIPAHRDDVLGQPLALRQLRSLLQQASIKLNTLDDEFSVAASSQVFGKSNLGLAVAGANAYIRALRASACRVGFCKVMAEH